MNTIELAPEYLSLANTLKTMDRSILLSLIQQIDTEKHLFRDVYEACFLEMKEDTILNGNSPASLQAFKSIFKKYIFDEVIPYDTFRDHFIEDITVHDVKTLKKNIKKHGDYIKNKPLSEKRLRDIYNNIDKLFRFAADNEYKTVSFCEEIKIYKITGVKQKARSITRNFLSEKEYKEFCDKYDECAFQYFKGNIEIRVSKLHDMPKDPNPIAAFRCLLYKAFFSSFFWAGGRTNELRGVKWLDLIYPTDDFPLYQIILDKQFKEKGANLIDKEVYTEKPKTDDSNRVVTLNVNLANDLKRLMQYLIVHDMYDPNQYIFFDFYCRTPKPIPESNIDRCFRTILDQTDIEKRSIAICGEQRHITPYGMRHAACCCLLERGMSKADVARYLGHSNEKMVDYVYMHFVEPSHQIEEKRINNIEFFLH